MKASDFRVVLIQSSSKGKKVRNARLFKEMNTTGHSEERSDDESALAFTIHYSLFAIR